MTEQRRIPVPPADDQVAAEGNSLLERAVGAFDPTSLSARPVPKELPEPRPKRRPGQNAAEIEGTGNPVTQVPVAPTPVSAPTEAKTEVAAELAKTRDGAPEPPLEPVRFSGRPHEIDRARLREFGLIEPEGEVTALLEEFRIVKRQLLLNCAELTRKGAGPAAQRMMIASPLPGEGKTYCAVNLALSIAAEKESEVLLVDADFAKPSVLSVLGLPRGPGLMDALTDKRVEISDLVMGTDIPGLWVLPAGLTGNTDSENLNSSRTRAVLDGLTQGVPNRVVIFDTPPVLAASPAAELAKYVAQAVMIVRADRTGQGALEDAVSLLSACPNIQLLLNGTHFSPSGRRFGSYYGYGV